MRRSALLLLSLFACGDDLDSSPLIITFEATPAVLSSEARSTFIFKVNGAVSRLTCTLDHGPAIDCQSPFTVPALDEGEHRFVVTATGEALQASHATHQWRVDLTAPETQLLLAPPALFAEETSTVMFAGAGDVARFQCALDDDAFAACASPLSLTVPDGEHTLRVRAVDAAGNADPTPASASWIVDTSAPLVTFTDGPIGPVASDAPTFAFTAPAGTVELECRLDDGAFVACASPFTTPELPQGAHLFSVRAKDLAGNRATAARAFLVDTVGPSITVTSAPPSSDATPSWSFTVADAPVSVQCRVDAAAWAGCADGSFTSAALSDGEHTFQIEARDALGNLGVESRTFSVDTATCGDGIIDPTLEEACDGENLGGATCQTAGDFDGGTLACSALCAFDTSGCRKCGNGVIESPETCDGGAFGDATCASFGFTAGALACSATCGIDTSGCGVCGDGTAQVPGEVCDGGDLRGATCQSIGEGSGTLGCLSGCSGYDTSGCSGGDGYVPANTGFTGTPCFDGLRYATPGYSAPYVLACTEEHGVYKTTLDAPVTWGSGVAGGASNLRGRAIATNPNGPPIYYVADPSMVNNAFRSSNQGGAWVAQSIANAGTPRELFSFIFRSGVGNIAGSWDAAMGATVLHGSPPNLTPHFVGAAAGEVTGTVRAIANGGPKDVYVVVYGQTPSGAPASGGIYRACDLAQNGSGGTYEARHTGLAADDLARVWSITVDPSSIVNAPFLCGATQVSGSATTYYAALRGGGQLYKTTDGGLSWSQRNSGLPAGAEVYVIALHCASGGAAPICHDPNLVYAATSVGLYRSTDGGASWALDGFAGKSVRAIAIDPVADPPHLFVGVDDAVGIYQTR